MSVATTPTLPPLGWGGSLAIFAAFGVLLLAATRFAIPLFSEVNSTDPLVAWFAAAGIGVFVPMLIAAFVIVHREAQLTPEGLWRTRLRFRPMTAADWAWGAGALVVIAAASIALQRMFEPFLGDALIHPPFMTFEPLAGARLWLLALWIPFWVLNVLGEEILWRGVLLPRQEVALGRCAWIANAVGWLVFHLAFGWQVILLLPILCVLPYIVQRRRNSWLGVIIHAAINGPAFVVLTLGYV